MKWLWDKLKKIGLFFWKIIILIGGLLFIAFMFLGQNIFNFNANREIKKKVKNKLNDLETKSDDLEKKSDDIRTQHNTVLKNKKKRDKKANDYFKDL